MVTTGSHYFNRNNMTDLSGFSNASFNAAAWINDVLTEMPSGEGENLESFIASINMKLHMAAQDYSEQLETAMVESISSMPRMVGEIARLEDQLKSVQKEMEVVEENIRLSDRKGIAGLEDLSRLDHLKSNMEKCKSTLEEHARWTQVVRDAKQLLEGGGILSDTADKINSMFISLDVLRNLPGHEERQDTCIKYRSTLLDALRPNIQQELNTMNIVALQEYLYVFRRLNCEEEFNKLYITLRPARIKEQWQSGSSDNKEYFSENVALYLGNLVRSVAEEETNITDLFGVDSVAKFSHSVLLQALEPMDTLLLESLQRLGDVHLAFETYTVLEEFSRRTIATLDTKDAKLKVAVMDAAFVGFWRFTTGYFEAEERMAKRSLYAMMDRISLLQQSDGNSGNELDPIEQLTRVAEQCQGELRGLVEETLRPLMQREARLFGGIFIRSSVRSIATLLQTCCKLLTLKVGNLALALGFPDFSQPLLGSSSGGALEPYSSFQDENAAAIKLAERISSSEVSRQGAVSTALHVYRAVLSFESLVDEVENLVSNSCSDIQRMVLSTFSTSAVLLDSAHPFGAIYGLYRIQNDEALSAEVKNFLNTATIATATNTRFQGMYSLVRSTSQRLTTRAREIILALSVSTPERGLAGYASEECWNRVVDADRLSEIQSNMLPLAVITAAGEHLLSLVQDLEGFAASASESGTISREDLLGLVVGSSGWRRAREILAAATDSKALSHLIDRVQVAKLIVVMEKEAIQHGGQGLIPRRTAEDINIEASAMVEGSFVNDWLIVIADAILGMIVAQLLQIRSLSLFGRAQLAIDIDYFVNVINATGIKPHPLQHHIKQLVSVGRQAEGDKAQSIRWKRVLSAMGQDTGLVALKDLLVFDLKVVSLVQ